VIRHVDTPHRWDSRVTRWDADGNVRCKACGEWKPTAEYRTLPYKDKRMPQSLCIPCNRTYQNDRAKERRRTEPGYRERRNAISIASQARYREAHRPELEAASRTRKQGAAARRAERAVCAAWAISACRDDGMNLTAIAEAIDTALAAVWRWDEGITAPTEKRLDRLMDLAFDHGAVWEESE